MLRSAKGTSMSLSDLTSMTMKPPSLKGSTPRLHSLSSTDSPLSTTMSFLTCTSSSHSSPLNLITSHCPLCHIPTVTDFSFLISRTPTPTLPPISQQWIWKERSNSLSRINRTSGRHLPSFSPTRRMLPLLQQVPFLQRKLLCPLRPMMGLPRSSMSGGPKSRSGLWPLTMPPLTSRRQRLFTCAWKALVQATLCRFASMSAWRWMHGQPGLHCKQRLSPSFSLGIIRSGQGPNSCVFVRAPPVNWRLLGPVSGLEVAKRVPWWVRQGPSGESGLS